MNNSEFFNSTEGKRIIKWIGFAVLMLGIFLTVETIGALKDINNIDPGYNSISVTGEGEMFSIPDIATLSFTVSSDAQAVSDAQSQVSDKMDKITEALKGLGIEEKDINTTDYSVYPKYTYSTDGVVCGPNYCPPGKQVADGYTASHTVTLKIRETDDAGKALSLVGDNGATNISGISFTTDDPSLIQAQARAEAIEDAKAKAKELAKELGVKIVRVTSFEDNTANRPVPMYNMALQDAKAGSMETAASLPIGQNKTTVSVIVTYEIK